MQYEIDERLKDEFESLKASAELIREGVNEYNGYIETYSVPYDFNSLMNDWRGINKAIDKIDTGLYFKSYEMDVYQDFVSY